MDAKLKEDSEGKHPTGQSLGVRTEATTPAASSEASSRGSRATTDSSTNTSGVESRDVHTDGTSETDSSETTSSYDSNGTPHDFEEPHVVAVDVGDDVEVAPWCEPCGSAAVAALALLAAFMITVVFMTLRALYGYDVEMTANDIDEEPTLSFLRLPEVDPCEDFQLHVCGGQARSHGIYDQIENEALNTLKALLESSSLPRTGHMATQKVVSLYRACVRFSKDGLALELPKIRHFLESLGLNLTGQQGQVAKDTMDNPVLPMLRLSLQYALHTFVAFHIDGLNVVNGKKIMRIVVSRADQDWFEERSMLSEQEQKDYYAGVLLVYEAKPLRPEIVMLIPDIANFESQAFKKLVEQRRIPKKYKSSFIRLENLGTYAHWYGQPDEWHDQLQQLSLFAYGANDTAHSSSAALEQLKLITQPEFWPKGRQLICWSLIRQMIGFGRNPLLGYTA
ncbi:hypothetical protein MRX96_041807 [Rhipicephalus microplus]